MLVTSADQSQIRNQKVNLFDPSLPFESARAIPLSWYYDPEIYSLERQTVFGKNWVAVGRNGDVVNPRSYFPVSIADEPVVVVRDANNSLKALSNVCRHRSSQLLTDTQGTLPDSTIQCPYHGWRYELTGRLCSAPGLGKVKGFSRDEHSLISFEASEWGPLVFVRMKKGDSSLSDVLAPLIRENTDKELSSLKWASRKEYDVGCNWKVYVDNYLDGGYHVPIAHPALAKSIDYNQYRTDVFDFCSLQHTPTQSENNSTSNVRQGNAKYWWVFPNLMVNTYKGVADTNIVLPTGENRCKVIFDFFFDDSWSQTAIDEYVAGAHQVQLEDMKVCESVQRGLKSNFSKPGPYAKREIGEYHFHQLLAKELQGIQ